MTVDTLHDALTLLPADLVAQTDERRCRKSRRIHWQRWAAMAACLVLILGGTLLFRSRLFRMGKTSANAFRTESAMEDAAEASPREEQAVMNAAGTLSGPPCLTVRSGDASMVVGSLDFSWTVEAEDSGSASVTCDGKPWEDPENTPLLEAEEMTLFLSWEVSPGRVTVRCRREDGALVEEMETEGSGLTLKPGTYLYEISAEWEQGSAGYLFRVTAPEKGD